MDVTISIDTEGRRSLWLVVSRKYDSELGQDVETCEVFAEKAKAEKAFFAWSAKSLVEVNLSPVAARVG